MTVDLQKVDAEIAALRSRLAAISDNLDECRHGYFEHPWAWSQMRRMLTIACSVVLMILFLLVSALVGDSCGLSLHSRSAISPAQVSGTSTLIGSHSD
jgi:hypothetical protein